MGRQGGGATTQGHPRDVGWPALGSQLRGPSGFHTISGYHAPYEDDGHGHPRDAGWPASGRQFCGPSGSPTISGYHAPNKNDGLNYHAPYEERGYWFPSSPSQCSGSDPTASPTVLRYHIPTVGTHSLSALDVQLKVMLPYAIRLIWDCVASGYEWDQLCVDIALKLRTLGLWKGALLPPGPLDGRREAPSSSSIRHTPRVPEAASPTLRGAPIRSDTYWITSSPREAVPPAPRRGRSRLPLLRLSGSPRPAGNFFK